MAKDSVDKDEAPFLSNKYISDKVKNVAKKGFEAIVGATINKDAQSEITRQEQADRDAKNKKYWCDKGDKDSCEPKKGYKKGGLVKPRGCGCATKGFGKGKC